MAPNGRSVNRTRWLGWLKDGRPAGVGIAAVGTRQVAHRKPRPGLACGVFGLQHPRDARSLAAFAVDGCVPMSSRCRWCRTATTSRRSAPRTGIWGSASLDDARQGRGPACSARAKSAPPRYQREDHRDRVLSDARRSSGPATARERETRNPIRPHDASRSPSVGWDEARIGMGRKGGDKFASFLLPLREKVAARSADG